MRQADGKRANETNESPRAELQAAVDLCEPLKDTSHIRLVGSGFKEEDTMDMNMSALYLTRPGIKYVSGAKRKEEAVVCHDFGEARDRGVMFARDPNCGITTHVPTTRKRGGISVREGATLGTHASADRSEGLVKRVGTRGW